MDNDRPLLSEALETKIAGLPTKPGVYLHKDAEGQIIYVGKAKSLRNRVRSYFQEGRPVDAKTKALVRKIADLEVIVTDTEVEALILENTLIKEHRPKYNILLKDDKSYPYIRITKEEYPRVFKTRRVVRDGSKYFGPYTDGTYLYSLLKTLRSIFPLRSCELALTDATIDAGRWKVCLDYHIKKCDGPCEGHIDRERYNEYIRQAQQVLNGRTKDLERQLEDRMMQLADDLRFEDAAVVRGRLDRLREYTSKQKVLATDDTDRDVFALSRAEGTACTVVFTIRDGKLIGKRHYFIGGSRDRSDSEILRTTIERWYLEAEHFPDEVLIQTEIEDVDVLAEYLREQRGKNVEILVPKIGDKRKLLAMAEMNADVLLRELLMQQAQKDQSMPRAILSLQQDLRMERMPRRIECFDNSHMQGTDYVSSMVVFVDGKPKKSEYRHFKLRTVEGNDDFEAMKEVITRRYSRALEEGTDLPDLVIIDGGKGQLSHAMEIFASLGLIGRFTVVGLAKRLEEVFVPGQSVPLYLAKTSASLRLLQQARDEAHRFAITYHRTLRDKRTLQTELTEIPGVGEASAQKLLSIIGSVERVRESTYEVLAEVVGKTMAKKVFDHYHAAERTT
ncbi:MAG: excinuclease ABC subunit C [Ignavibacteria bacterium]|nr:excinuclease ABC subunit C [Ignavibacteria bacterium]MBK7412472.1 excinuclease ABC subunit C [Ignavibacteria bacterium]